MCCKYFAEDWQKVKPFWNEGWIFDALRVIFWFLNKLTISNIVVYCLRKLGARRRYLYLAVDTYLAILFIVVLYLLLSIIFSWRTLNDWAIMAIISWMLFGLFRVWISHFLISTDWNPVSLHRTLILVLKGYLEVIISYTILAFILREHFEGITCWQQALVYSFRNAATIGSSDMRAIDGVSYSLLITQITFVLLFLTVVINRIFSRRENA